MSSTEIKIKVDSRIIDMFVAEIESGDHCYDNEKFEWKDEHSIDRTGDYFYDMLGDFMSKKFYDGLKYIQLFEKVENLGHEFRYNRSRDDVFNEELKLIEDYGN